MGKVDVSAEILIDNIRKLQTEIEKIQQTRKYITTQHQMLGSNWNDAKYKALGGIINDCVSALRKIEIGFLKAQKSLIGIADDVNQYESIDISNNMLSDASGFVRTRHLSHEEVSERWKGSLECVDEQIEIYEEALMARGVPRCSWLSNTLAEHRAAMLEQENQTLDIASGHEEDAANREHAYNYPSGDFGPFYNRLAHDFEQYCLEGTNPNYESTPECTNNCQRCVPTYEARRRGGDVTAYPSTFGSSHLSYYPFDVWEGAEIHPCEGSGRESIQEAMAGWGDGARAQVVIYQDHPLGGGHTFIAEQRNGVTCFTDPQTGNDDVSDYFNRVAEGRTRFCRIDNLQFSSYCEECFREVE